MSTTGFALVETPIGHCGIAWGALGIVGVQLPEGSAARTRARLEQRFAGSPEATPTTEVRAAQREIVALLSGEARDLSRIRLDMHGLPDFRRRVYEAARTIPPGATCTYGELAKRIGSPAAARAVGQALGHNPFAIIVPCHRVLAANGRIGGFSADGGVATKQRLLAIEAETVATPGSQPPEAAGAALDFDVKGAVRALRKADPKLAPTFDSIGACELAGEIRSGAGVFATLTEAIVAQQLSAKAASTIHRRLCALFPGQGAPTPRQLARASEAKLRGAGLSRAKACSLIDLAQRTLVGEIPSLEVMRDWPDDEIVARLSSVRGIGRWTAQMFLIFRLGRPDVLAADDFALRKGFQLAMRKRDLPTARALAAYGECWAPWRTVASWYLWRLAERGRT